MFPEASPILASARAGPSSLEDPLYYLHNFRWVLDWVHQRYADLLSEQELQFVYQFQTLPQSSQGLLVRMVMRKGELFRADKLRYPELGPTETTAQPLIDRGWVKTEPVLDLTNLFRLFTWSELRQMLHKELSSLEVRPTRKSQALELLQARYPEAHSPADWGAATIRIYQFNLMPLCERFRLMFFGNPYQDWSEFVLTELGAVLYETVAFTSDSRPFNSRAEVDAYLQILVCRERFYNDEPLAQIAKGLPSLPSANPWLKSGRDRLVFKLARELERRGGLDQSRRLYEGCHYPGARGRLLRVMEQQAEHSAAYQLALTAEQAPESEAERQQLTRLLPRLRRKLGLPKEVISVKGASPEEFGLELPLTLPVELAVKQHLEAPQAPVHYVENSLLTGLFGLLCWEAIFAPLPGAFFHPFQRGPADLHWPDFHSRRAELFDECLGLLEGEGYREQILACYDTKYGRQSPFVHWGAFTEELLHQSLAVIPSAHLKLCFERLLLDLKANRAGLPDLIQFWPEEGRYQMIEVKAPGDRLQDNQRRWLDFFIAHDMPVSVCHVTWQTEPLESLT